MSLKQNTTIVFPDKARQIITTPIGDQIVVINGEEGFMLMGDKVQPMPPARCRNDQRKGTQTCFISCINDDSALEFVRPGGKSGWLKIFRFCLFCKGVNPVSGCADGKIVKQT